MRALFLVCCLLGLLAAPLARADVADDRDDGLPLRRPVIERAAAREALHVPVAVLDVGDAPELYVERLAPLSHEVSVVSLPATAAALDAYDVIILPLGHGADPYHDAVVAATPAILGAVAAGKGLWISQPNPWNRPDKQADVVWAAHPLVVDSRYEDDLSPWILSLDCLTWGLEPLAMPYPYDTVLARDAAWQVLAAGDADGELPALLWSVWGDGRIMVELQHPVGLPDAMLQRMIDCLVGEAVATASRSWSELKGRFR
jgi:hypothetical protein